MALANCPKCGALFNKLTTDICKKCYEEEEKLLRNTQEYLRKNRNAAMFEVIDEVGVEQPLLEKWVQEKRIILNDPEAQMSIPRCPSCGREMKPGQSLCKTCQIKRLASKKTTSPASQEAGIEDQSKARSAGMHFKRK